MTVCCPDCHRPMVWRGYGADGRCTWCRSKLGQNKRARQRAAQNRARDKVLHALYGDDE